MRRKDFIKLLAFAPLSLAAMQLKDWKILSENFQKTQRMPLLFLGHGSPMNAIEENEFVAGWRKIAANIEKPKAILCISAHWETKGTFVTAMEQPKTIHDFGGFPQALFDVKYPAAGDPQLANEIKNLVQHTELELDHKWGLDHGAWSVIKPMYPDADIPVLQMSIDYRKPVSFHHQLAEDLSQLREKGVLIIGSGNMVHHLGLIDWRNPTGGYDWAIEANEGFKQMILEENLKALFHIQAQSKAFALSVPSLEHYLPLIYVLGLKKKEEQIQFFNDKLVMGSISMTSLIIS